MGVYTLSKITLIVPRSELPEASGYIAELGDFHPTSPETDVYDKRLSALASSAYKISSELTYIIDNLKMNIEPSAIQKAFAGIKYDKTDIEAWNWEDYISKLDGRSSPIISSIGDLIRERRAMEKRRDDLLALKRSIEAISSYNIDLGKLESMRRFRVDFVIVETSDLPEIRKSLPESTIFDSPVSDKESALLVVGTADQADRISKSLRSFDARSVTIPKDLPQSPSGATKELESRLSGLSNDLADNQTKVQSAVKSSTESILGLQEAADFAYRVLEELKKSGKPEKTRDGPGVCSLGTTAPTEGQGERQVAVDHAGNRSAAVVCGGIARARNRCHGDRPAPHKVQRQEQADCRTRADYPYERAASLRRV